MVITIIVTVGLETIWSRDLGTQSYICGVSALLAGINVAFKQTAPEHKISFFKVVSVRVKFIPLGMNIVNAGLFLIGLISQCQLILYLVGTFVSFIYLRFYKHADGVKGDRSETFSFKTCFPDHLEYVSQGVIYKLGVLLYRSQI